MAENKKVGLLFAKTNSTFETVLKLSVIQQKKKEKDYTTVTSREKM